MELNEYQTKALKTALDTKTQKKLVIAALGLGGESGEVLDHIKKYYGHDHPLDMAYLKKELGDILWYIAYMADALGIKLEDVAFTNIEKLKKRYPNGFNSEDSLTRKD